MFRWTQWTVIALAVTTLSFTGCGGPPTQPAPIAEVEDQPESAAEAASESNAAVEPMPVSEAEPFEPPTGPRSATVYRDTWGVPHIFADHDVDAAYAIGYTQAEDRLDDIYLNLRTGVGRLAEVVGKDGIETDVIIHATRTPQVCQSAYKKTRPALRAITEAYFEGIAAYLADHPDRKSPYAFEIEPWMTLTLGRLMQLRWAMGDIMGDLKNTPRTAPPQGSNQWSVAPSRSAEGCAILCTDVHQTWEGPSVFHEARVHGGELQMCGMFIVGAPLMAFGHTDHFGWAPTTGGPDVGDVYKMKMDPASMIPKYEYDGEWLTAELDMVQIQIKDAEPMTLPVAWTKLGPILPTEDAMDNLKQGFAYVGSTLYFDETDLFEQFYDMYRATNAAEVYETLRHRALIQQNLMYADTGGTIGYVRFGRTATTGARRCPVKPPPRPIRGCTPSKTSSRSSIPSRGICRM